MPRGDIGVAELTEYRCDECGTSYRAEGQPILFCGNCGAGLSSQSDSMAAATYRIGYATYTEARRRTSEATRRFEHGSVVTARAGFNDAAEEFEASVDRFTTAKDHASSEQVQTACEQARKKATCYQQAVEWLGVATYAREKGQREANRCISDATGRVLAAREYGELTDPDALRPKQ